MILHSVFVNMRFEKQPIEISVENNDLKTNANNEKTVEKRHGSLLPSSIKMIITGGSGTGKTNSLLCLIKSENGIRFENIYIYSKTMEQDKYKYLEELIKPIKDIGFYKFDSSETILKPSEIKKNSLVIFDDIVTNSEINKTIVKDLFTVGRHRNLDVVYLTQTYAKLSKHLIRDNCNFLVMFRQDITNLKHIYDDFTVAADLKFNEFHNFCLNAWKEPFGFVCISTEDTVNCGKYRKQFDQYLQLDL